MLANRLSVLLAEREKTIKETVNDTGISRNTLSNMVNNPQGNISMATVDKLCNYLEIEPVDFFVYSPYLINNYFQKDQERNEYYALIEVTKGLAMNTFRFDFSSNKDGYNDDYSSPGSVRVGNFDLYCVIYTETDGFNDIYTSLQPIFKNKIVDIFLCLIQQYLQTIKIGKMFKSEKISMTLSIDLDQMGTETLTKDLTFDTKRNIIL